jgi:hypothetical protein
LSNGFHPCGPWAIGPDRESWRIHARRVLRSRHSPALKTRDLSLFDSDGRDRRPHKSRSMAHNRIDRKNRQFGNQGKIGACLTSSIISASGGALFMTLYSDFAIDSRFRFRVEPLSADLGNTSRSDSRTDSRGLRVYKGGRAICFGQGPMIAASCSRSSFGQGNGQDDRHPESMRSCFGFSRTSSRPARTPPVDGGQLVREHCGLPEHQPD